jgi:site-specific DNA recombinase
VRLLLQLFARSIDSTRLAGRQDIFEYLKFVGSVVLTFFLLRWGALRGMLFQVLEMKKQPSTANQAVAYIRCSTLEQTQHGVTLEAQEERLRAYCLSAGLDLVAVIREGGVSGSVPLAERPQGAELLSTLRQGAMHVVALKLDRLFRDAEDALRQTRAWDKAGVALHLVDLGGQSINTASAMGRMMLTMMAAFAELERNLIAERTTQALQHKRNHRQVFNHTPYGYTRNGSALVASAEEQAIISRIHLLRSNGATLSAIADALNSDAVPSKRGGTWYARTVLNVLNSEMREAA